eukprot:scaffold2237_cov175-Ochromonas_danica.AAC.6
MLINVTCPTAAGAAAAQKFQLWGKTEKHLKPNKKQFSQICTRFLTWTSLIVLSNNDTSIPQQSKP